MEKNDSLIDDLYYFASKLALIDEINEEVLDSLIGENGEILDDLILKVQASDGRISAGSFFKKNTLILTISLRKKSALEGDNDLVNVIIKKRIYENALADSPNIVAAIKELSSKRIAEIIDANASRLSIMPYQVIYCTGDLGKCYRERIAEKAIESIYDMKAKRNYLLPIK